MTVTKSTQADEFLLRVDAEGRHLGTDPFETPQYAMQFADYLWDNVISDPTKPESDSVQVSRSLWDQARILYQR